MRTGDFLVQLLYAEQSVELEAENKPWSWKLRTGDFVVQL